MHDYDYWGWRLRRAHLASVSQMRADGWELPKARCRLLTVNHSLIVTAMTQIVSLLVGWLFVPAEFWHRALARLNTICTVQEFLAVHFVQV